MLGITEVVRDGVKEFLKYFEDDRVLKGIVVGAVIGTMATLILMAIVISIWR